jgi:tRNA nucleotidyltransferase (CCA-adding enzyme)
MIEFCRKEQLSYKKVHGSRDYFSVEISKNLIFEIVPVLKIAHPRESENVTDLSYFHVGYVKKKINTRLAREIILAKAFCKACGVYGAESYIQGFSGYALECLIINYGSFEKFALALVKSKEKIVIDSAKQYSKKEQIFLEMNESKLSNPIVLVDPTWKERNVLAALSQESFDKLVKTIEGFFKKPNEYYFQEKEFDEDLFFALAKKRKLESIILIAKTNRQEGDIAGTKLKKFYRTFIDDISSDFKIDKSEFIYNNGKEAKIILSGKQRKETVIKGPPANLVKHAKAFRKEHLRVYEKKGKLFAPLLKRVNMEQWTKFYLKQQAKKIKEMAITNLEIRRKK